MLYEPRELDGQPATLDGRLITLVAPTDRPGPPRTLRVHGISGGKVVAVDLASGEIRALDRSDGTITLASSTEKSMAMLEAEIAATRAVFSEVVAPLSGDTLDQQAKRFLQEFYAAVALRDRAIARLKTAGITLEVKQDLVEIPPPLSS